MRVFTAAFYPETNTFSPLPTGWSSFQEQMLHRPGEHPDSPHEVSFPLWLCRSLDDVVKNTIWLQDARDFGGFNRVYSEFFPKDPPARSTVGAQLMLDARIEIESVAYKPLGA